MIRNFIPAITSGQRPTASIIAYGARRAALAFSLRRTKTYFSDFLLALPATSVYPLVSGLDARLHWIFGLSAVVKFIVESAGYLWNVGCCPTTPMDQSSRSPAVTLHSNPGKC